LFALKAKFQIFILWTASVVLDIGRPVKVTASTTKLQHVLNMAHTFHDALLPVVHLAKPAADAEKPAEGDTVLPQILHFYLVDTVFLQLIIMLFS